MLSCYLGLWYAPNRLSSLQRSHGLNNLGSRWPISKSRKGRVRRQMIYGPVHQKPSRRQWLEYRPTCKVTNSNERIILTVFLTHSVAYKVVTFECWSTVYNMHTMLMRYYSKMLFFKRCVTQICNWNKQNLLFRTTAAAHQVAYHAFAHSNNTIGLLRRHRLLDRYPL